MDRVRPLPELLIRKPVRSDAAAIATLHVRSWQCAYYGLLPAHYLSALDSSVERRLSFLTEAIDVGNPCIRVAELNGQVVGWLSFGPSRDEDAAAFTAELMAIYLDPPFWAHGIGSALWAEAQQVLKDDGYRQVSAWVLDGNERARRFYLKHGFIAQAVGQRFIEDDCKPFSITRFCLVLRP